mmetsp:Transcript_6479/g.23457  ORF Transcript_6479/g.23457 Transcript_6479/m.23457 type:complete len:222 (-) Transcript_6479:433-1098(-)
MENLANKLVSIPRPMPSRMTKSASLASLTISSDKYRKSITGISLPLATTRNRPSAIAGDRMVSPKSTSAGRMCSTSSSAVMSLIDGTEFAASTTCVPRRNNSRANGIMPNITSAPLLSTNMIAFACGLPSNHRVLSASKSSTHHGRFLSVSFVDAKSPPPLPNSAADSAAPKSKIFPAKHPRTTFINRSASSALASTSARTLGNVFNAARFSSRFTRAKQS